MDTKPQTTKQQESAQRYRRTLLKYVSSLPLNEIFEEGAISEATKELGQKVPKMFVRELLDGVEGINQELLNFGKPDGRVCRIGPVETGSEVV